VKPGVPAGGEFTATAHADDVVTLTPPPTNPAAVLAAAVGTDKDPNSVPWPERPANSRVEVYVNDDDLNDVLRRSGYQGDEADAYSEVYASIDLLGDRDCDFYGITPEGKEELIALEVTDYEQAVEPLNHQDLHYRNGFANPMPEFLASRNETIAKRHAASEALLQEAGITVELEDLRRGYYRLKRAGSPTLELRTGSWPHKIIETTNWREATGEHLAEFLGGDAGKDGEELFRRCATLVAQHLNNKAYADKRDS
jgi:hypothetical protein